MRNRRHDGEYRWFLTRAAPLRDTEGRLVSWFGSTTDIHDRKLGEQQQAEALASEQAARSLAEQAIEGRDTFISMVTHDLRTPLTAVRGYAQLMKRRGRYDEQALASIIAQTVQLGRLIEDLADVARFTSGQPEIRRERLELVEKVRACLEEACLTSPTHTLRLRGARGPLWGEWDPDRLCQVLQNLLSNAIKYAPGGGEIVVRIADRKDHAEVSIRDHGLGIPPEALPRLFDRYYRVERSARYAGGLGLGLFITRLLVQAHGGRIWAESDGEGEGSTFTFTLPYAAP